MNKDNQTTNQTNITPMNAKKKTINETLIDFQTCWTRKK